MKRKEFSINIGSTNLGQCILDYPDEVVFVFNPLYLDIHIGAVGGAYKVNKVTVRVSGIVDGSARTHSVNISLYKGRGKVYLSRLMELFFDDVRWQRSKTLTVQLIVCDSIVWQSSVIAVWGNLSVGERFSQYGAFKFDNHKPYFERKRVWFKNFPFMLSMFAHQYSYDEIPMVKYDGRPYDSKAMVYFPNVDYIFDSTDDESINGIAPTMEGSSLEYIVYIRDEKKFYGMTGDGFLARSWTSNHPYLLGSENYNSEDQIRENNLYSYENRLMRYDRNLNDLVVVHYGNGGKVGIYEVCPDYIFPNAIHNATLKQQGKQTEGSKISSFDKTFDYTFFMSGEMTTITKLIIDHSKEGVYLRWIDRFGMYQYYLFSKGKTVRKNKLGSDAIVDELPVGGMYFSNHERTSHIDCDVSTKCGAPMLEQDIYDYVSSIVTSPIIDIYMGMERNGEELWVPVNIVASSYEYDPQTLLHDLEIEVSLPSINAQTL